jgi:hypothetical protein
MTACEVANLRGEVHTLQVLADKLLQLGQADGMRFFQAYGLAASGYLQRFQAQPGSEQSRAGLDLVRRGMQLWETIGTPSGRGMWIVWLASACLQAGEITGGLQAIANELGLEQTQPHPQPRLMQGSLAEIHRLRGELLLRLDEPDPHAAEACFEQSLAVSRAQGAHTWELRAALSLARLWQIDRPQEARRLLAEVCAWFTEGFDTTDWQAAQALLKELGAKLV